VVYLFIITRPWALSNLMDFDVCLAGLLLVTMATRGCYAGYRGKSICMLGCQRKHRLLYIVNMVAMACCQVNNGLLCL
jgi:hypothetical protein